MKQYLIEILILYSKKVKLSAYHKRIIRIFSSSVEVAS